MNHFIWKSVILFLLLCRTTARLCDLCDCHDHFIYCNDRTVMRSDLETNREFRATSVLFKNCDMGRVNKYYFQSFRNISQLRLYRNTVDVEENAFQPLTNLIILEMPNNNVVSVPKTICRPRLKILQLSFNKISKIVDDTFIQCQKLTMLFLDNNIISVLGEKAFAGLISLAKLDLSNNKIYHVDTSVFIFTSSLKVLCIERNNITSFGPQLIDLLQKQDLSITLEPNPLQCDCHSLYAGYVAAVQANLTWNLSCSGGESWHSLSRCNCAGESNSTTKKDGGREREGGGGSSDKYNEIREDALTNNVSSEAASGNGQTLPSVLQSDFNEIETVNSAVEVSSPSSFDRPTTRSASGTSQLPNLLIIPNQISDKPHENITMEDPSPINLKPNIRNNSKTNSSTMAQGYYLTEKQMNTGSGIRGEKGMSIEELVTLEETPRSRILEDATFLEESVMTEITVFLVCICAILGCLTAAIFIVRYSSLLKKIRQGAYDRSQQHLV